VHEVAVTGVPAILVPWADAAEDHQTLNVGWLADRGAAVSLAESDISLLASEVARLRSSPDVLAELSVRAGQMGETHRGGALADVIESVAAR
jgi:UDP-N-acetylglucosamine--N-acetylmuramyl-(pentapeptide) pyrophosphoryl-undecaprenol N-acetylglucosamine transferase